MLIRRFRAGDESAVSRMIAKTLSISNAKDYPADQIEELIQRMNPQFISACASQRHFYVAEEDGAVIGCASIGPFWGKTDESGIFTVFVDPEHQKLGVGKRLISILEKDEYFLRADRVEIPASITAVGFYMKLGYEPKSGDLVPDEERLIPLEKRRKQ
ncbi:MAG: GNAT family N-acetyltransferase [Clostridiales bacterium]|nr:GNAT family N-acetyltransferase [Clostridiales bacterium]